MALVVPRRKPFLLEGWQQLAATLAAGGTIGAGLKSWFDLRKRRIELDAEGEQSYYTTLRQDIVALKADQGRTNERLHNAEQTILKLEREGIQKDGQINRLTLDLERSNIERDEALKLAATRAADNLSLQTDLATVKGRNHALTQELAAQREETNRRRLEGPK